MTLPAIETFLDACDTVLNSNTFLLTVGFDGEPEDAVAVRAALRRFLDDGSFQRQLYDADRERNWHNLHDFVDEQYRPRGGTLVRPHVDLELTRLDESEARLRLERMLTAEDPSGTFWSPYRKQLAPSAARALVEGLLWCTVVDAPWAAYALTPNFCFDTQEAKVSKRAVLAYFEGTEWASDSATLLVGPEQMWLLLTNGCD